MEEWVLRFWFMEAVDHHEESGHDEKVIGLVENMSVEKAIQEAQEEAKRLESPTLHVRSWVLNREKCEMVFSSFDLLR